MLNPKSIMMYYILLFCLKLISHIPFRIQYVFSDILYFPFYYLVRYRRKLVRRNLTESFPEKSQKEIVRIEKRFYQYFLDTIFESIKLLTMSPEEMRRRAVFKNAEAVNAFLDSGKPVALYIGHYGNWEWITTVGLCLSHKAQLIQIYHKFKGNAMERIMRELRERMGNKSVLRDETVRFIANAVKQHVTLCVGFLSDQSPKRRESKFFIPFLHHNVPVLTGTEKLVKHFGYAAFYLTARRIRRGYYEYEFIPLCDDSRSLPDFDLTCRYFERLEQEIQREPELYLWSHNRFKYAKDSEQA